MWPFRRKQVQELKGSERQSLMQVLSVLSPEQQQELGGIPAQAIAGVIDRAARPGQPISPDTFRPNPAFSAFLHHVIDTLGRRDPDLIAAARGQVSGSVGIIDLRTPEGVMGRVPLEDIIGIFAVENGELGAYHPNDKHVVFSANGLVQVPGGLRDLHVRELMRIKVEPDPDDQAGR